MVVAVLVEGCVGSTVVVVVAVVSKVVVVVVVVVAVVVRYGCSSGGCSTVV